MSRGIHPASRAALEAGAERGRASRQQARAEGLAYARAWREKHRAEFDAMYGPTVCPHCGGAAA